MLLSLTLKRIIGDMKLITPMDEVIFTNINLRNLLIGMEVGYSGNTIEIRRTLSELDKFVIDFVELLRRMKIRYVIVSGYVAILFGRTRGTEDVDFFIEDASQNSFDKLMKELDKRNLWIVNTSSTSMAYEMLKEGDSIRIAKKNDVVPNMEIKIAKTKDDKEQLENPVKVVINGFELPISPIESQIAYKFWLGSEKDIEDAVYLYELFKEKLDKGSIIKKCKELNVLGTMIKYVK